MKKYKRKNISSWQKIATALRASQRQILELVQNTNLKKQSQFPEGQMNVSVYMKGDYEVITATWARKNIPNSKPIIVKGKRKKAKGKMSVSPEFLQRGYLKKQSQC